MSGFNKRSRLSPSKGTNGSSSKDQPQSPSGASGQQKAPGKKLQWSMGDLLTKLDSGDGTGDTVEEAMAQARAGDLQEPPPVAAPVQAAKPAPSAPAAPTKSEPIESPPEKPPIITAPPKESLASPPEPNVAEPPPLAEMPAQTALIPEPAIEAAEPANNNNHHDEPVAENWQDNFAQSNSVDETFNSEVASTNAESDAAPVNGDETVGHTDYAYTAQPEYAEMGSQFENAEPVQEDYSTAYQDAAGMTESAKIESYTEAAPQTEYTETEMNTDASQAEYLEMAVPSGPAESEQEVVAQDEYSEVIAQDEQPEVIAYDEQPEVIAQDEQPEVIAYDEQPEVIAHDEQPEVIAHDEQPEVIARDEQPEVIAHDEQPEVIAHDEQHEVIAYEEQPEVIAHDEQPEVIAHDEQPEVIAHDEQPEIIAHDEQPEIIAHDEQPEVIAHDEQPEIIAHDEQPEAILHDEQPEITTHDEHPEVIAHDEYSEIAQEIAQSASTETESATTSNEQIGKQIEHAEPAIKAETASLQEQPAEPTKMPPGVSDDPEDTGEIPGAAFKDYMVTMKSAKSETSDATDATPGAADTAGLKPEPPTAKPAFGAAAMLMKKAAEKKSEILKEKPGQTKEIPEPAREERDEPYSFTRPEFDAPEPPAGTQKSEAESKPKFDLENETGRIDMSQLKSLPEFGSKPTSPAGISASDLAAKFGRRDDETGRINMRELMQQMPPHMAAALDKSAKSFEPGEEPQIQPAPSISNPTSPPNQFNRDAILPNIKANPSSSKTNLPSKEAEASPAPDATDKTKKKKTKESGKPKPAGEVVKNIQKMAPLSSIRAAEHHDLATQEVKAEHRELLNQTNQIKNKMLTVPDNSQESELERVWKQRFRSTIQFAGKHQRHLVAVASIALFIVFGTVIASNMAQEDLLKQISDKWQHKQYDDATNLVDRGLAQFPNNANLHFFKARLLNKAGQEDQALSEVSTAVHLDPNNVAMIEQRAKLYLEMRRFDQAIEDYNRLVSPPNDKTAKAFLFADLATAHIEKKEFAIARSFADRAVQLEPNKPDYYATRAYAENGMSDFNGAINDWTSVISKDKKDANAYAERARAEFSNHQTAKALADLAKSLAVKQNGTAYYYRALIYLDQKKQPLAIQELTQAVKYDSANSTYRDALAQIYANSGNFEQAMRNYDAVGALQRNSDSPDVLQNRIMTEMHEERFSEAARDLDRYIALKPDASWAVFCHAGCCVHTKEYSKAYDDYTNLIAKEPNNAVYYAGRGEVNAKEQHFDLASADFEKAIALDPKKAQIYVYRGRSSADQGLYDQALIDLKHALALQPDNAVAKKIIKQVMEAKAKARPIITSAGGVSAPVTRMTGDPIKDGYNLMTAGNLPDAIQVLAKAVVKSPNNATARRYLAYCLLDNGNSREAIAQFKALDVMGVLNSTDDAKYIQALKSNGNLAEASVLVARKLAIHPDSIDTRIELANLYAQLSWKQKARQVLMEGMSHSTSPGDTATLQGVLNSINNALEQAAPGQTPNGVPPPHKISG